MASDVGDLFVQNELGFQRWHDEVRHLPMSRILHYSSPSRKRLGKKPTWIAEDPFPEQAVRQDEAQNEPLRLPPDKEACWHTLLGVLDPNKIRVRGHCSTQGGGGPPRYSPCVPGALERYWDFMSLGRGVKVKST